jgi:subtilisin family serine protease
LRSKQKHLSVPRYSITNKIKVMKKFILFGLPILALLTILSWSFTIDDAWQDKVDVDILAQVQNGESTDFLILLQDENEFALTQGWNKDAKATYVYDQLRQRANTTQANVAALLNAQNAEYKAFFIVNMIYTNGNADLLQAVAEMPEVLKIQSNPVAKVPALARTENAGSREATWGVQMINADDVWAMGYTGEGVVIGGQDTGYEWEHPALKEKYRGWDGTTADHNYNWHDAIHEMNPLNDDDDNPCGYDSPFPCDDNNHGTHTMGTMIGTDEEGENEIGVAPGSSWIACRNMERGWGQLTTYVECFEWFLAPTDIAGENPDPTKAPHVIANSWGCPEVEGCNPDNFSVMETALNNLRAAGTVVVVSAGNSGGQGCGSVTNPAAIFEGAFSIGATNNEDAIAGFSSRGPVTVDGSNRRKPDVSAPGVGVLSSIRGGGYQSFSGTSMAGPHVAGAVALIISANPELAGDVDAIENILEQTAVGKTTDEDCGDIDGEDVPNNTYGYGRIDVLAAVEMALEMTVSDTDNPALANALEVAPNPFTSAINFSFEQNLGAATLEIYSVSGQLIRSDKLTISAGDTYSFDLNGTVSGVYFYAVRYAEGTIEGKVIKQ